MTPNKRELKAFVRLDGSHRTVPSSLILRKNKPKVGNWVEVPAYECCNGTSSTTTTTSTTSNPCVTYRIVMGPVSTMLSYTDCDGTPVGPIGMNGPLDDLFCCFQDSYSVEDPRGVTITFYDYGCPTTTTTTTVAPTTTTTTSSSTTTTTTTTVPTTTTTTTQEGQ